MAVKHLLLDCARRGKAGGPHPSLPAGDRHCGGAPLVWGTWRMSTLGGSLGTLWLKESSQAELNVGLLNGRWKGLWGQVDTQDQSGSLSFMNKISPVP